MIPISMNNSSLFALDALLLLACACPFCTLPLSLTHPRDFNKVLRVYKLYISFRFSLPKMSAELSARQAWSIHEDRTYTWGYTGQSVQARRCRRL